MLLKMVVLGVFEAKDSNIAVGSSYCVYVCLKRETFGGENIV